MTDSPDLSTLDRLAAQATPEPWTVNRNYLLYGPHSHKHIATFWDTGTVVDRSPADAVLTAALRNAAPALIAELRALRAEMARLRPVVEAAGGVFDLEWAKASELPVNEDAEDAVWGSFCAAVAAYRKERDA